MKLTEVEIEGFRSIKTKAILRIEPNVTVVLGPNDHGKSNLIAALKFLNIDEKFDKEKDLNWDLSEQIDIYPRLLYCFKLTQSEWDNLTTIEAEAQLAAYSTTTGPTSGTEPPIPFTLPQSFQTTVPQKVIFYREGVSSALMFDNSSKLSEATISKIQSLIPRVELIKPSEKIEDSVTADQLTPAQNDFMRGIFFYGGLDPDNLADLFSQDDQTMRKLENASQKLETTLKQSWSQGEELGFILRHNSKTDTIDLRVKDPAVQGRFVRASHRSSGFTTFFAIKTILHARQQTHHADSYIYLFDEPGLYLHPSGQYDLLQVLETLGTQDQVLYVTHSLFLINKSHPTRHRLISKTRQGTVIDGKPYVGHWGVVLSALGLSLFGTILFASEILLTEGDSDPIYIQACFQKLIADEKLKIEINGFSAMGTGDGQNAHVMLWTLSEAHPTPKIMMLFDGDEGGKVRETESRELLNSLGGKTLILADGLAIEDYLIGGESLFIKAVVAYFTKWKPEAAKQLNLSETTASSDLATWKEKAGNVSLAKWCTEFATTKLMLKSPLSKVGIAREYVLKLQAMEEELKDIDFRRCLGLLTEIKQGLKLPDQTPPPSKIFES